MLEFITSLLILVFSLNAAVSSDSDKTIVFEKLQENLPIISITPASYQIQNNPAGDESEVENNVTPDTNKSEAYNTESNKVIDNVTNVAIDNSPPITACSEDSTLCNTVEPGESVLPTPESTPPIVDEPIFIGPPEVLPIEPPIIIPPDPPITPPHNPCRCSSNKDIVCLIYPCAEAN